jgi:hypothetical protein
MRATDCCEHHASISVSNHVCNRTFAITRSRRVIVHWQNARLRDSGALLCSATSFGHADLCDLPITKGDEIAAEFRIAFNAVRDLDRV